jgi:hypothetical protein
MQHGVGPKKLTVAYRLKAALQRFCFCGLVPPYRVKQAAKRQAKQCTALVPPYRVKQAAKRQAKQCTALFCPHPLTITNYQ